MNYDNILTTCPLEQGGVTHTMTCQLCGGEHFDHQEVTLIETLEYICKQLQEKVNYGELNADN